MKTIKINDKVRFLNASGGGVVRRVDRGTAWVETSDGFEIPTPISECVVVDDTDTYTSGYKTPAEKKKQYEPTLPASAPKEQTPKAEPVSIPKIKFIDRPGGDNIEVYVAFLPTDFDRFADGLYELYLINRSNYSLNYLFASRKEEGRYHLREQGVIDPDSKIFVTEFATADLNDLEYQLFQFLPYKVGKGYDAKQPLEGHLQIDKLKFFKRHAFKKNIFFDEDALVYPLIEKTQTDAREDDAAARPAEKERKKNREGTIPQTLPKDLPQEPALVAKPNKEPQTTVYDLHIQQLLDNPEGMTPHEILLYQIKVFERELNKQLGNKGDRIIFIHGKGQGVLRQTIIDKLGKNFEQCSYRDASFEEYGFGAIEITVH